MREIFDHVKRFFVKNILWIIIFVCSVIFLDLAEDVFEKEIMDGDIIGYEIISRFFISDKLTPFVGIITEFGGIYVLLIAVAASVLFVKQKKYKILIPTNLVIILFLNQALKFVLQRPRPEGYRIINETGYSFPSGHSMLSMAVYGYFIYMIYKGVKNRVLKWTLIVVLAVLIMLIGLSRIYLGVHYTSDVVAGFMISIVYLIMFVKITDRIYLKGDSK